MFAKRKICVAITARPSYSRIKSAMMALQENENVELLVLCSGSSLLDRYGEVINLIKGDGFDVVDELYTFVEGNEPINMALTAASTIHQSAAALKRISPDFVVTIADRYETLGTAVAASYLGIPLVHVQGGEVTGNIDERVRHAVSKLSDYHLVANERAADRLVRMGEQPDTIFNTGCPSIDIARDALELDIAVVKKAIANAGVGADIDLEGDYLVVLQHPDTDTYADSYQQMQATVDAVSKLKMPTLMFWPNVDAGSDATSKCLRVNREVGRLENVRFIKNLEGKTFLRLLKGASCIVGNSSVGLRECAYLGTPTVNIGERQNGRDRATNVKDVPHDEAAIISAVAAQLEHGPYESSEVYGQGRAGEKISDVLSKLSRPKAAKVFYDR